MIKGENREDGPAGRKTGRMKVREEEESVFP
jgi:hypothetical protein